MKVACVIPARYASSRFPGKPLALLDGKPMIQWVYNRAIKSKNIDQVIVATDDKRIADVCAGFSAKVVMTDPSLASGTDRVYQAIKNEQVDVVVNLQGDEPFISPDLLDEIAGLFSNPAIKIATPIKKITNPFELTDPNLVRVVRDINNYALYFSRAAIPFSRDIESSNERLLQHTFFKHIGIYAYRKDVLGALTRLPESTLEKTERLEQLRFLENGYPIYTHVTRYESLSVDTQQDLENANQQIKLKKEKF